MLSNDEIDGVLRIAKKIRDSQVSDKKTYFAEIFKNFKEKYPMLYDMCCEPNFDMTTLEYMTSMMRKINAGHMDDKQASVQVGQHMFDKYVAPIVSEAEKKGLSTKPSFSTTVPDTL